MQTIINYSENEKRKELIKDLPENESDFYKGIAEELINFQMPNSVSISCKRGELIYTIIKKSESSFFIKEDYNTVDLPI